MYSIEIYLGTDASASDVLFLGCTGLPSGVGAGPIESIDGSLTVE